MGIVTSKGAVNKAQPRVLLLGLDGAGKSSMLYRLKLGEEVTTSPTIGFNVESVMQSGRSPGLSMWDVGGQDLLRNMWSHYYPGTDGLLFVVDSADVERIPYAKEALVVALSDSNLDGAPLVVMANKQDLPGALGADEVGEALGLAQSCKGRDWVVKACSVPTGHGLRDGVQALAAFIKKRFKAQHLQKQQKQQKQQQPPPGRNEKSVDVV
ncbi:uncharacterized protein LOC116954578 [Petromyzon marinus]|uniref:ADP-ribosylation factor-like protein 14 n=1 Tax=Petromyzon marinus TaxID=7757 RepID=A0AAJ7XE85_PETMA|nr:ADP-ribosylation factor-like [Petromyzon marinus]